MRKTLSVVLASTLMIAVLTGCPVKGKEKDITTIETIAEVGLSELQAREGCMLRVSKGNCGEMCNTDDEWSSTSYEISWDGKIVRNVNYMLSGSITNEAVTLSEEDYMTLFRFAESAYINESYAEYSEQAADGASWSYVYFPEDCEDSVCLYRGYAYSNEELCQIQEIVKSYFSDETYYGPLHTADQ